MPRNGVLSYPATLAYGVGHVFNDLCASMWFTYLLIYFNSVLQIDNRLSGAALAIGQLADGISTQLVGIFSDKDVDHWLCRYGRRKSWHLVGWYAHCMIRILFYRVLYCSCFYRNSMRVPQFSIHFHAVLGFPTS